MGKQTLADSLREIRFALRALLVVTAFSVAYFASIVIIPVVCALFLAILLTPAVDWLCAKRVNRGVASGAVLLGCLLVGTLITWMAYLSAYEVARTLPESIERMQMVGAGLYETLHRLEFASKLMTPDNPATGIARVQIVESFPAWTQYLVRGVGSVYEVAVMAIFIPMLLLYFLIDKRKLVESSSALLGRHFFLPKIYEELPRMLRAFSFGNVLIGGLLVIVHCAVLFALGAESWLALGTISGLFNILPLVGAPLSIIFPIFGAVTDIGNLPSILIIATAFTAAHFFASNVVLPMIVGSKINVNAAALVVGLLFWGWLWGALGFLLAIPMTAALKILMEANRETVPLANLMAVRPKLFVGAFEAGKAKGPKGSGARAAAQRSEASFSGNGQRFDENAPLTPPN